MNLRHMEVFHAVYTNGSVVRAAQVLNVSQPSVSKVLAHAEIKLGFRLFQRVGGRLVATDEAHILFREIDEIHGRMYAVREAAKNLRRGLGGYLRLAVLPALGLAAAPKAVAELLESYPTANLDIQTLHHQEMLRSLIERDSDLAVGYAKADHPRLESQEIAGGELVALFRRDVLPDAPPRLSLAELKDQHFITLANSGPMGSLFSSEVAGLDLDLKERVSVRTFYMAAGLVAAGAGMAVIDQFTAQATLTPELCFRPLDPPIRFGVHAMFLTERPPSILGAEFLKRLGRRLDVQAGTASA